ncbi:MAG: signal peptidase II, partial [Candidatus Acidiferrum sp.]
VVVTRFIEIVRAHNPGIAFSFFADASSATTRYLLILGSVVIIGIIAWLLVASRHLNRLSAAGLALLLAGATGNLTDRILHGSVTDFLQVWLRFLPLHLFNPWPAFNVADSAVTIGAILIVFDVLFSRQHPAQT